MEQMKQGICGSTVLRWFHVEITGRCAIFLKPGWLYFARGTKKQERRWKLDEPKPDWITIETNMTA